MDEMTMLRALGAELDPEVPEPSPLRARVLAGLPSGPGGGDTDTAVPAAVSASVGPLRRVRGSPRRLRLGVAAALTAVLAGGLVAGGVVGFGDRPPAAEAAAAQILHRAAAAAARAPALRARPDQFLYFDRVVKAGWFADRNLPPQQYRSQSWLSVDGRHTGLFRDPWPPPPARPDGVRDTPFPGCAYPGAVVTMSPQPPGIVDRCTPMPAYRSDLPTDAGAMLQYLNTPIPNEGGGTHDPFVRAFDLLTGSYLPPRQQSAAFDAVAMMPGVHADSGATDYLGRPAIGIGRTVRFGGSGDSQRVRQELLFDPKTYACIGDRLVALEDGARGRAGTVINASALRQLAVVDRAGQLP